MTFTGWLTKIFKGSSHKVQKGYCDVNHGSNTDGNHASTSSLDAWSETEEIDRAIALSLYEEDRNGKNVIDSDSQLKEDEQLARALQESMNLNIESPPQHGNQNRNANGNDNRISNGPPMGNGYGLGHGHIYQPPPYPYSMGFSGKICAGCRSDIAQGTYLTCMGVLWHPECFRCHACNQPISDYEFSMNQNFRYHKLCYREQYHPKCDICKQFIPTNAQGLIEYRAHPFWHQKYCPFHEHDGTPRCCSCERMEAKDSRFVVLEDGRKLCLECLDSSIMDTNVCQPLYFDIKEFYEGLNMKVEQQVPLLLVERQALNEAMDGEKIGHHHMPETRGLCLSEEQTVSTVLRRPKAGGANRVMAMRTEPYKLTRRCEVTAILILYGLPRLLTGSILAHEMMHAWLRLKGFRTLSQDVEEGICQVLAHMWLESQIIPVSSSYVASSSSSSSSSTKHGMRSPLERKLGEFFKHQIEQDTSHVYGNGFRAGNAAVLKYGLQSTLEHIRYTGTFPF